MKFENLVLGGCLVMKIQRTINGNRYTIELLPGELIDAFYEQQDKFDIESIVFYGEEMTDAELEREYGCTYSEFLSLKEEMAREMRRAMDKYGMNFEYARDYAIRETIKKNIVAV